MSKKVRSKKRVRKSLILGALIGGMVVTSMPLPIRSEEMKVTEKSTKDISYYLDSYKINNPTVKTITIDEKLNELKLKQSKKEAVKLQRDIERREEDRKEGLTDKEREAYEDQVEKYLKELRTLGELEAKKKLMESWKTGNLEKGLFSYETLLRQYNLLQDQEVLLKKTWAYYEELLEIEKLRKEVGMATDLDVSKSMQQMNAMKTQHHLLATKMKALEEMIRIEGGLEAQEKILFSSQVSGELTPVTLSEKVIQQGYLDRNVELKLLEEKKKVEGDIIQKARDLYSKSSEKREEAELAYELFLINVEEEYKNHHNAVTKSYSDYQHTADEVSLAKKNVQLKQQQYDHAKEAYKQNQLSEILLKGVELELEKIKIEYSQAQIQYLLSIKMISQVHQGRMVQEAG